MVNVVHLGQLAKLGTCEIPDFSTNYDGPMILGPPASTKPVLPPVVRPRPTSQTGSLMQTLRVARPKQTSNELRLGQGRLAVPRTPEHELSMSYSAISASELERIRKEATQSDTRTQKALLDEERRKLHELSQVRVEKWSNTILGQRRARLKAIELKEQRIEEEKEKIDREWAKQRALEQEDALSKARQKQFARDPRVRMLHSQVLISKALAERQLQIALITTRRQELGQREQEEALAEVRDDSSGFNQMLVRSTDAKERSKRKRLECAMVQLQQIEKKKEQLAFAKQADRNFYKAASCISLADYVNGAADQAQQKTAKAENFQKEAQRLAESKMKQQACARDVEDSKQQEIDRFIARKEKREASKKAVAEWRLRERERMVERLAQQTAEEQKLNEEKKLQYVREVEAATDPRREQELAAWEQRRVRDKEEIAAHRRTQLELAEKQKKSAEEQQQADRQHLEQEKKEADEDEAHHAVERKEREMAVKEFQKRQIDENARRHEAERAAELATQLDALKALEIKDEEFNAYAEKLIRDWHEQGRDIGPLMRALQGTNRKRVYEFHRILNTYDRLGLHMF